jgi:ATP adenylyltransferase/5',5'''-P-1,P-4-tetraphosphate phosphorylase II
LVLTSNFLIIALRGAEAVKTDENNIGINALGFAGTLAVKSQSDFEFLK